MDNKDLKLLLSHPDTQVGELIEGGFESLDRAVLEARLETALVSHEIAALKIAKLYTAAFSTHLWAKRRAE